MTQFDAEARKLWAFLKRDGIEWMVVLKWAAGSWRVLTYYPPKSPNYRTKQAAEAGRSLLLKEEGNAGGGP